MIKFRKNRIGEVVSNSIEKLSNIIDVNTVIGTPVDVEGGLVIPIAKVTFCVIAGGGEYGKVSIFKGSEEMPFSAGNGSVVSIKPCGFLIKNRDEDYKVLSVSNNNLDGLFDKTTDFIKDMTKPSCDTFEEQNDQ